MKYDSNDRGPVLALFRSSFRKAVLIHKLLLYAWPFLQKKGRSHSFSYSYSEWEPGVEGVLMLPEYYISTTFKA